MDRAVAGDIAHCTVPQNDENPRAPSSVDLFDGAEPGL